MRSLLLLALVSCSIAGAAPQIPYKQVPTTGYIDPTVSMFNGSHPLVACTGSCATALVNQNIDALQAAIVLANGSTHPWIYIPPGEYPIGRGGPSHNQPYGVLLSNVTDIVISGYGATIRGQASLGGSDYYMFKMDTGTQRVRFLGLTLSQRDLTSQSEQTHMIQLGNGKTAVTDVQIINCHFVDGKGGDAIRLLGGSDSTQLVKRVVITGNAIDGKRSGIGFQHGTNQINVIGNWFGTHTTDQMIDYEPSSVGGTKNSNIMGNFFHRPTPTGTILITLSGYDPFETGLTQDTVFADNVVDAGGMNAIELDRTWVIGNSITNNDSNANLGIDFFRKADTTWIQDNWIKQNTTGGGSGLTKARSIRFAENAGYTPKGAWITGNTLEQWTPLIAADIGGSNDMWLIGNNLSYHNASNLSVSNGYIGMAYASGWACENTISRGYLADGVTLAGTAFAGILLSPGTYSFTRDNMTVGVRDDLSVPSGTPFPATTLISGNVGVGATNHPLTPTFITHWTQDETVASGALSAGRRVSLITTDGTQSYTIGDCVQDGSIHSFKVYAATNMPNGTLTPDHFGDGTSITWTGTARFRMACDETGTHWLLDSSGITVNP